MSGFGNTPSRYMPAQYTPTKYTPEHPYPGNTNPGNTNPGSWLDTSRYLKDPNQPVSKYEDLFANQATSVGPSNKAKYLEDAMRQEAGNAVSDLNKSNLGSIGQGLTQLGMRGGVKSGTRERMVNKANIQNMRGAQSIYSTLGSERNRMLAGDEASKEEKLAKLLELANQRYGFNTVAEASSDSAEAQLAAANKKGFISKLFSDIF